MAETLFGTVPPIWSAVPFPGLAWFQTPVAGTRPIGDGIVGQQGFGPGPQGFVAGPQGLGALGNGMFAGIPMPGPSRGEPYAFNRGIVPVDTASGFGGGSSNFVATPASGPFSPVGGQDIAGGVTAAALVMAVALRRGQPAGPTSDQEIDDFIYDALDLLPGSSDVEVRCDAGRTTLTGTVSQKVLKRDIGEIAWAIPGTKDVQNNITIAPRRRGRAQSRDSEASAVVGRKSA